MATPRTYVGPLSNTARNNYGSSPETLYEGNLSNGGSTGGRGGGGSGGGGGGGVTDKQRRAQANLGGISGFNFQTPQLSADLADKAMDIGDRGNANIRDYAVKNARRKASGEWYKSQQDLQSVASQLADASGNLANGSGMYDFMDLIARRDDQQDVEVLNAAQQNNNARNQAYIDAQEAMRSVGADYVAQSNNIDPELASGMINTDAHNLTLPDWLNSDGFAEKRFRQAVSPAMQGFFRPDMAARKATESGAVDREPTTVNEASTNQSYWSRMRNGYGRRNE